MRKNAWTVQLHEDGRLKGIGGSGVEMRRDMIAEGAWSAGFSAEGLRRAEFRCGSGITIHGEEVIAFPPSHSLEGIFCFVTSGSLWFSNSLHLLVALVPGAMPEDHGALLRASRSLKLGVLAYDRQLYQTASGRMLRFAFGPVAVSRENLTLREEIEVIRSGGRFRTFADYHEHLNAVLADLLRNARDPARTVPYGALVTTCSGGYDSAACAALAAANGAELALTISSARGGSHDSGKAIANSLGLHCLEFERFGTELEGRVREGGQPTLDAAEVTDSYADFLATTGSSEDLYFNAFAPHLEGALLLTGFHGDKVWARGCPSGEQLARGDMSGSGLDEFRKALSFVHVPVPFIGARHSEDIARIDASDEMTPWRGKGGYARPLPRRIAEEGGVSGHLFGQKKAAASVLLRGSAGARRAAFAALVDEYRRGVEDARIWEM